MISLDLGDLARAIFPPDGDGLLALLWGYFDESGLNNQTDFTVVAGFVGPSENWAKVNVAWQNELKRVGVELFHYTDCRGRNGPYKNFNRVDREPHLQKLAEILSGGGLVYASAIFKGDWPSVLERHPDKKEMYPHPYNICFELLVQDLIYASQTVFDGQPLALVFADQQQFKKRAIQTYDVFKHNNAWPEVASLTFASPLYTPPLQCADMLAWEAQRYMSRPKKKMPLTNKDQGEFPLISRLIPTESIYEYGSIGSMLTASKVIEMLSQSPARILKMPASLED